VVFSSHPRNSPHSGGSGWRNWTPWILLALIAFCFLGYLGWLRPADNFGGYHDDTLYFSAAQALARGEGYRMPSVPGSPPHTKYPVFYAWLLSHIWKWQPEFPANVGTAVWMTAFFAVWYLVAAFLCLRKVAGFGDWSALAPVALCAFQAHFLFLSGSVLSDMLFMALAMTAAVMADRALERGSWILFALAGVVAGLSVMTRTLGLAVVAGIAGLALYRRAFRPAVVFCLAAAPFLAAGVLGPLTQPSLPISAQEGGAGWRQTWLFYTSYLGYWKLSLLSPEVYWGMLQDRLAEFLMTPADYCLFPPPGGRFSRLGRVISITLTTGILIGAFRQARRGGWRAIHFIFALYTAAVLVSIQGQADRYFVLFLPLFYAGLWGEARNLGQMVLSILGSARPAGEKALAGVLAAGLLVVAAVGAHHTVRGYRRQLAGQIRDRFALGEEKKQLYDWIRQNTDPGARFVAYEDICLYFYTGRQAMRPIAFSTAAFQIENQGLLERELAHITDVARHIGARYWVSAADDFHLEQLPPIVKRMAQVRSVLPLVFQSRGKRAQIYDLSCLFDSSRAECAAAAPVLFPGGK